MLLIYCRCLTKSSIYDSLLLSEVSVSQLNLINIKKKMKEITLEQMLERLEVLEKESARSKEEIINLKAENATIKQDQILAEESFKSVESKLENVIEQTEDKLANFKTVLECVYTELTKHRKQIIETHEGIETITNALTTALKHIDAIYESEKEETFVDKINKETNNKISKQI